jgi:hypothetical protein
MQVAAKSVVYHWLRNSIDIKGSKVWIQANNTDLDIAADLVTAGVPKEDIVLAFHAPYKRPYTGFAVG